ncbi:nuclear factor interleukin-3-regulated protein-like [Haliotis rubra]|uniref:nuclear factor interleukin-3-regulated protein-like n=1 Tax=Haliotis rubra TaxID=36100 RepID=UPI001EE5313E|nr:nuclear factor interleukin-3-regulated protein-like [Haliotis rubra]
MTHHQQYAADSATWLTEPPQQDGPHFMPKVVQRRAKRIIPDLEKDDKYWEKRKRNNLAAKRSRENKRKLEVDIRHKMSYLEEDNALLRKEIALIKAKFGIPPEQSLLTPEERAQCMQEVKAAQAAAEASSRVGCDDVYPVSLLSDPSSPLDVDRKRDEQSDSDDHDRSMSEDNVRSESAHVPHGSSAYGPYNPSLTWGASAQHFQHNSYNDNQRLQGISNGYNDKTNNNNNYQRYTSQSDNHFSRNVYDYYAHYTSQGQSMYSAVNHLQGVTSPADLTIRNKRSEQDVIISNMGNKNGGPEAAQAPNNISSGMTGNLHMDSSGLHAQMSRNQDLYSPNIAAIDHDVPILGSDNLRRENVVLKERLNNLTSQVEKMKSIVLKE